MGLSDTTLSAKFKLPTTNQYVDQRFRLSLHSIAAHSITMPGWADPSIAIAIDDDTCVAVHT